MGQAAAQDLAVLSVLNCRGRMENEVASLLAVHLQNRSPRLILICPLCCCRILTLEAQGVLVVYNFVQVSIFVNTFASPSLQDRCHSRDTTGSDDRFGGCARGLCLMLEEVKAN
ncbi:hypothetical protein PV326_004392 [Microctonus aethiopoides]|nr:hypothetical protein PV326_004392 [Microctonus aethiopoides]